MKPDWFSADPGADEARPTGPAPPAPSSRLAAYLAATLEAERERWPLWLPVGFGTGIAVYFLLAVEPPLWLGSVAAVLGLVVLIGLRHWPVPAVIALAVTVTAAGFATAQLRTASVSAPVLDRQVGPATVGGRIVEVEPHGTGRRVILEDVRIPRLDRARTPARVRINLHGEEPPLAPGDRISVRAVLRPPPAPAAPGAFDFQRHAFFARLGGVGYALGSPRRRDSAEEEASSWRMHLAAARQGITARVRERLDGAAGAIAAALITGERGAIPSGIMAAMRDSGLAHLLAISGLHMGLVAGILFFAARAGLALVPRFAVRYPIKKWAAVAAFVGAFAYLLISGATIPTRRAFVMTGLVLLAVLLDRTAISMRLVAWAAAAVLLLAPESLLGASFQMSFAAVVGLVAAYEALRGRIAGWRAAESWWTVPGLYLAGIALSSIIAILATAPFAIYHFNRFAGYGLAANLVAVPLTGLWIMPWAIAALLLMPAGLEGPPLAAMGWGIDLLIAVAQTVSGWPGSSSLVPAMPGAGLALVAFGGLWLCLWRCRWRLFGLPVAAAGLATILLTPTPDILVAGDGRVLAVRADDGTMLLSSRRAGRFSADVWLRREGQRNAPLWPKSGYSADNRLVCDNLGCIYRVRGQVVALVRDGRALAEDCRIATILVSTVPVRAPCRSARTVVDRFDLWRKGGHALWLAKNAVTVRSVKEAQGDRPWVPRRGPGG